MSSSLLSRDLVDLLARSARLRRAPSKTERPQRLRRPSLEQLDAFRRSSRPVLLDGLLEERQASGGLTLDDLRRRIGDREVSVIRTKSGRLEGDTQRGLSFETVRVAEYLDRLERGEPIECYVATPGERWLPELSDELPRPIYCRDSAWVNSRFWLGPAGTCTPLHRDVAENVFVQLIGRKRFFLYPPAATAWLYSNGIRSALPNFSRFDPEKPDYERFPLAREVEPVEVVLEAGEAMYLPSRWWHQVRSLDVSASLNFWFANGALAVLVRLAEFVKRARRLEIYGLEARLRSGRDARAR